jgi:hypothetical protein
MPAGFFISKRLNGSSMKTYKRLFLKQHQRIGYAAADPFQHEAAASLPFIHCTFANGIPPAVHGSNASLPFEQYDDILYSILPE